MGLLHCWRFTCLRLRWGFKVTAGKGEGKAPPRFLLALHFCLISVGKLEGGMINKAEVDVFLEFPCFFYDPMVVGNLISVSSAFSKSSLNIWKLSVHVLLKPIFGEF